MMKLTPEVPKKVMKKTRTQYKEDPLPIWEPDKCYIYYEEAWMEPNQPYLLPLVILKTRTCSWLSEGGGCTMCNYQYISSFKRKITEDNIINQVKWALEQLSPMERFPYIHLTSSGSFLDPKEVSNELLVKILKLLKEAGVKILSTESRPEYVLNEERLQIIKDNFDGYVTIGMGLEAFDDFIRTYCINKGTTIDVYRDAIKTLKKYNLLFHLYILLGKPFLTVKEDIDDALNAIKFAVNNEGVVILFLVNRQPFTLTNWLLERNKYELPSLWSAVQVLEMLEPEEREKVWVKGLDKAVPMPSEFPSTCPRCTPFLHNALVGWNYTRDFRLIEQITDCCGCKDTWSSKLEPSHDLRLKERVEKEYEWICRDLNIDVRVKQ